MANDRRAPTRDDILAAESGWGTVLICGALATLPLLTALAAVFAVIAVALVVPIARLYPTVWPYGTMIVLFYGATVGAVAALLYRWGQRSKRWGDIAGGLLLWPASFPPAYAFVVFVHGISIGSFDISWLTPVSAYWQPVTIEAVAFSAVLATSWFASWRAIYVVILRRVSGVDQHVVMTAMLRQYFTTKRPGSSRRRGLSLEGRGRNLVSWNGHGPPGA